MDNVLQNNVRKEARFLLSKLVRKIKKLIKRNPSKVRDIIKNNLNNLLTLQHCCVDAIIFIKKGEMANSQKYIEKCKVLRKGWELSCIQNNNIPELLEILNANRECLDSDEEELFKKYQLPLN